MLSNIEAGVNLEREKRKNSCVCDENLLVGMKMFRETLTFRETSRKILDIYVSAALSAMYRPGGCHGHRCCLWTDGLQNTTFSLALT